MKMVSKIILFTGPINSGKTTKLRKYTETQRSKGTQIAGLLSVKNYNSNGIMTGYNLLNIKDETTFQNGIKRKIPCNRKPEFYITEAGLDFGRNALALNAVKNSEIVIFDEFGPLELKGLGWRKCVEDIIDCCDSTLLIMSLRPKIVEDTENFLTKKKVKPEITAAENFDLQQLIYDFPTSCPHK